MFAKVTGPYSLVILLVRQYSRIDLLFVNLLALGILLKYNLQTELFVLRRHITEDGNDKLWYCWHVTACTTLSHLLTSCIIDFFFVFEKRSRQRSKMVALTNTQSSYLFCLELFLIDNKYRDYFYLDLL